MWFSLSQRLIFYVVSVIVSVVDARSSTSQALEHRLRPVMRNTYICQFPHVANGVIKMRLRGKILIVFCNDEYTLVGQKYLYCREGRWDAAAPSCIKSGCEEIPAVGSGFIYYAHQKASATLFCSSSYQVAGSQYSYCNGTHWDRALGNCRRTGMTVQTGCDFEVEDLCGWTSEAAHSFSWKRSAGVVSRRTLKTGPKHDHTTMVPLDGHFLMIDSAEQLTNATTRLISPIFTANYSRNACFQFFYHMYGDSVGTLSVFVKPLSVMWDDTTQAYLSFSRSGSQGNAWQEGHFDLQQQAESFQIVFEASLGMRFKSDIAIDDVSLMNGEDCIAGGEERVTDSTPAVVEEDEIFRIDSCENRCNLNDSAVPVDRGSQSSTIHCECSAGCLERNLCCPDYLEQCVVNEMVSTTMNGMVVNEFPDYPDEDSNKMSMEKNGFSGSSESKTATLGLIVSGTFLVLLGILIIFTIFRINPTLLVLWRIQSNATVSRGTELTEDLEYLTANEQVDSVAYEECQAISKQNH